MSILYMNGFDSSSETIITSNGWVLSNGGDAIVYTTSNGRFSGHGALYLHTGPIWAYRSISLSSSVFRAFAWINTWNLGISCPIMSLTAGSLNSSYEYRSDIMLAFHTDGKIRVGYSTDGFDSPSDMNIVGVSDSTYNFVAGETFTVEWEVDIRDTAVGSHKVYINGVLEIDVSSVRTSYYSSLPTIFALHSPERTYFDDLVLWDDQGSDYNTFPMGDRRIDTVRPASDDTLGWTTFSGTTGFGEVDDTSHDSDSTYIYSTATDQLALFAHGSQSLNNIDAVRQVVYAKKGDAVDTSYDHVIVSGTTTSTSNKNTPADYSQSEYFLYNDPNTSAAWTGSGLDALKHGVKSRA